MVGSKRPGAVVLARGMNGLGVVRSLGMESVPVCYVQTDDSTHIAKSHYVKHLIESKSESETDVLAALQEVPAEYVVLIVGSDYFVDILKTNKDDLSDRFKFILPQDGIVQMLNDKKFEVTTMGQHGVPVPTSFVELEGFSPTPEQLPLIIKPRTYEYFAELGKKNVIVNTIDEYDDFATEFAGKLDHYIAQEIIVGDDENLWVCNCTFGKNSELIQTFIFNRIRTQPAHYGVTSFARSMYNEEIAAIVAKLGKALHYVGPAMVEFKVDDKDGKFKYIEINPRIGMCNIFDTKCGVNNVYASYCLSLNETPPVNSSVHEDNIYFLDFYNDFKTRVKDGESVVAVLNSYLKVLFKKKVYAFWDWKDIKPGFDITQQYLGFQLSRFKSGKFKN